MQKVRPDSLFTELKPLAAWDPASLPPASIEVSLIIPAKNSHLTLADTVQEAHEFFRRRYGDSFEIILVPNPTPGDTQDLSTQISYELEKKYPTVRVRPHTRPRGKGAALRTGFQGARGKWIFFTDSDLPYSLDFFDPAMTKLKQGYHLINGNRRLLTSEFHIPVRLLPLAYRRHRLGMAFNRLVRWLFPISTTDTQAGIKALSRELAIEFFKHQTCPGFLYDLELFLTSHGRGYPQADLPVVLYLNSEKSTIRILRECVLVAYWLTRIKTQQWKSRYHPSRGTSKLLQRTVLNRYQHNPAGTRAFLTARWWLTPYTRMASHLPPRGRILDLGCGHGLFSLAAALHSPARRVIGVDHDRARIAAATEATRDLENLSWQTSNLLTHSERTFSGVAMIDVMHYFEPEEQKHLLRNAFETLDQGGTLIVREVNPNGGLISRWNRLYERIATGIGFTQSAKNELYFRSRREWEEVMREAGFKVTSENCSSILFADILYVCERPAE